MEFPGEAFKLKKDRYARKRDGSSRFLYIACGNCDEPAMVYQKDGSGKLLRYYTDRIVWPPELVEQQQDITPENIKNVGTLACSACENPLATPMVYKPEDRAAYRVIPGSIHAYRSVEQALARAPEE